MAVQLNISSRIEPTNRPAGKPGAERWFLLEVINHLYNEEREISGKGSRLSSAIPTRHGRS
jgi:hypothetical protein